MYFPFKFKELKVGCSASAENAVVSIISGTPVEVRAAEASRSPGEKKITTEHNPYFVWSFFLILYHATATASLRVLTFKSDTHTYHNMLRASLPRHLRQAKPLRGLVQQSQLRGYKEFAFGNDARTRMAAGVDILAKAVSATLGPKVR